MVNESDILDAVSMKEPFYMEYRFVGSNDQNKSGRSAKFWLLEWDPASTWSVKPVGNITGGLHARPIISRFGPIGSWGQRGKSYTDLRVALADAFRKEKKGYHIYNRLVGDAAREHISGIPNDLIPFSQWASALPAPFNTIAFLDSDGFATNHDGALVCRLSVEEAAVIRHRHDMTL